MNDYISHLELRNHPAGDFVSHTHPHPIYFHAVKARTILDSRGNPTVQVSLTTDTGLILDAAAPSGASTGAHEAVELRDGTDAFGGKGVESAIGLIRDEIAPLLTSRSWAGQRELDEDLRELDGTGDYRRLGANSVVAVSMAAARGFAASAELTLHGWISQVTGNAESMPVPHFNVLNGGAHASNDLAVQEFMIAPVGAAGEHAAVQAGAEIYHALAGRLRREFAAIGLGDEGGFAPPIGRTTVALDYLMEAISDAGYTPGVADVAIALDPAANGFSVGGGRYRIDGRELDRAGLVDFYSDLVDRYPIRSIEDGFAEDDVEGWRLMAERLGDRIQIVGDDLYVTDARRIRVGAEQGLTNAALIKVNQIGTVSQTFDAIAEARASGMACMISHRSGETCDSFIADLAVGTGVGQIKAGAPARGERTAKYNRLTEIEASSPIGYGLEKA